MGPQIRYLVLLILKRCKVTKIFWNVQKIRTKFLKIIQNYSGTPAGLLEQPQASGTREAQMEQRAAPYPYSRMCNVCNVCNVLTNKSKRYCTASSLRASLLACSDIAAVCCDSCIVRWQEILSPFDWPPWLLRSTAALKAILDKVSWRLILRTFSFSQLFLKNIDTFLKKLT